MTSFIFSCISFYICYQGRINSISLFFFLTTIWEHNASLAFTMRYRLMVTGISNRLDQITILLRFGKFPSFSVHFLIYIFSFSDRFMTHKSIQINERPAVNIAQRDIKTIKEIGQCYEILCEIMDDINSIHSFTVWTSLPCINIQNKKPGFQIMLRTGFTFVVSIFTFYSLYEYLIISGDESMKCIVILHLNWISIFIFNNFVVIYTGSQVARKVHYFVFYLLFSEIKIAFCF